MASPSGGSRLSQSLPPGTPTSAASAAAPSSPRTATPKQADPGFSETRSRPQPSESPRSVSNFDSTVEKHKDDPVSVVEEDAIVKNSGTSVHAEPKPSDAEVKVEEESLSDRSQVDQGKIETSTPDTSSAGQDKIGESRPEERNVEKEEVVFSKIIDSVEDGQRKESTLAKETTGIESLRDDHTPGKVSEGKGDKNSKSPTTKLEDFTTPKKVETSDIEMPESATGGAKDVEVKETIVSSTNGGLMAAPVVRETETSEPGTSDSKNVEIEEPMVSSSNQGVMASAKVDTRISEPQTSDNKSVDIEEPMVCSSNQGVMASAKVDTYITEFETSDSKSFDIEEPMVSSSNQSVMATAKVDTKIPEPEVSDDKNIEAEEEILVSSSKQGVMSSAKVEPEASDSNKVEEEETVTSSSNQGHVSYAAPETKPEDESNHLKSSKIQNESESISKQQAAGTSNTDPSGDEKDVDQQSDESKVVQNSSMPQSTQGLDVKPVVSSAETEVKSSERGEESAPQKNEESVPQKVEKTVEQKLKEDLAIKEGTIPIESESSDLKKSNEAVPPKSVECVEQQSEGKLSQDTVEAGASKNEELLPHKNEESLPEKNEETLPQKSEETLPQKSGETLPQKSEEKTVPQKSEETLPQKSKETLPQKSEETLPEKSEETLPQKSEESLPEKSEETLPQKSEEKTVPQKSEETLPQKSAETLPQKSEETLPQKSEEKTVPQKSEETLPQKSEETLPQKSVETLPQKSEGTLPQKSEETLPQKSEEKTVPQKSEETLPQKSEETLPQKSVETLPQKSEETLPQKSEETLPQKSEESLPQKCEETLPQKSEETLPQKSVETLPQKSEETLPQKSEEKTVPQKSEETLPQKSEETLPQKSEETLPQKSGETLPQKSEETAVPQMSEESLAPKSEDSASPKTEETAERLKEVNVPQKMEESGLSKSDQPAPSENKAIEPPSRDDSVQLKSEESLHQKSEDELPEKSARTVSSKFEETVSQKSEEPLEIEEVSTQKSEDIQNSKNDNGGELREASARKSEQSPADLGLEQDTPQDKGMNDTVKIVSETFVTEKESKIEKPVNSLDNIHSAAYKAKTNVAERYEVANEISGSKKNGDVTEKPKDGTTCSSAAEDKVVRFKHGVIQETAPSQNSKNTDKDGVECALDSSYETTMAGETPISSGMVAATLLRKDEMSLGDTSDDDSLCIQTMAEHNEDDEDRLDEDAGEALADSGDAAFIKGLTKCGGLHARDKSKAENIEVKGADSTPAGVATSGGRYDSTERANDMKQVDSLASQTTVVEVYNNLGQQGDITEDPPSENAAKCTDAVESTKNEDLKSEGSLSGQSHTAQGNLSEPKERDDAVLMNEQVKTESASDTGNLGEHVKTESASDTGNVGDRVKTESASDTGNLGEQVKTESASDTGNLGEHVKTESASDTGNVGDRVKTESASGTDNVGEQVKTESASGTDNVGERVKTEIASGTDNYSNTHQVMVPELSTERKTNDSSVGEQNTPKIDPSDEGPASFQNTVRTGNDEVRQQQDISPGRREVDVRNEMSQIKTSENDVIIYRTFALSQASASLLAESEQPDTDQKTIVDVSIVAETGGKHSNVETTLDDTQTSDTIPKALETNEVAAEGVEKDLAPKTDYTDSQNRKVHMTEEVDYWESTNEPTVENASQQTDKENKSPMKDPDTDTSNNVSSSALESQVADSSILGAQTKTDPNRAQSGESEPNLDTSLEEKSLKSTDILPQAKDTQPDVVSSTHKEESKSSEVITKQVNIEVEQSPAPRTGKVDESKDTETNIGGVDDMTEASSVEASVASQGPNPNKGVDDTDDDIMNEVVDDDQVDDARSDVKEESSSVTSQLEGVESRELGDSHSDTGGLEIRSPSKSEVNFEDAKGNKEDQASDTQSNQSIELTHEMQSVTDQVIKDVKTTTSSEQSEVYQTVATTETHVTKTTDLKVNNVGHEDQAETSKPESNEQSTASITQGKLSEQVSVTNEQSDDFKQSKTADVNETEGSRTEDTVVNVKSVGEAEVVSSSETSTMFQTANTSSKESIHLNQAKQSLITETSESHSMKTATDEVISSSKQSEASYSASDQDFSVNQSKMIVNSVLKESLPEGARILVEQGESDLESAQMSEEASGAKEAVSGQSELSPNPETKESLNEGAINGSTQATNHSKASDAVKEPNVQDPGLCQSEIVVPSEVKEHSMPDSGLEKKQEPQEDPTPESKQGQGPETVAVTNEKKVSPENSKSVVNAEIKESLNGSSSSKITHIVMSSRETVGSQANHNLVSESVDTFEYNQSHEILSSQMERNLPGGVMMSEEKQSKMSSLESSPGRFEAVRTKTVAETVSGEGPIYMTTYQESHSAPHLSRASKPVSLGKGDSHDDVMTISYGGDDSNVQVTTSKYDVEDRSVSTTSSNGSSYTNPISSQNADGI